MALLLPYLTCKCKCQSRNAYVILKKGPFLWQRHKICIMIMILFICYVNSGILFTQVYFFFINFSEITFLSTDLTQTYGIAFAVNGTVILTWPQRPMKHYQKMTKIKIENKALSPKYTDTVDVICCTTII